MRVALGEGLRLDIRPDLCHLDIVEIPEVVSEIEFREPQGHLEGSLVGREEVLSEECDYMVWPGCEVRRSNRKQLGSTDRKTCFCPSLKPGNWRATVFATSAMVVVEPGEYEVVTAVDLGREEFRRLASDWLQRQNRISGVCVGNGYGHTPTYTTFEVTISSLWRK